MFEWLNSSVEEARKTLDKFSLNWGVVLEPPAIESDIKAIESTLGKPLPISYRNFLLKHNGAYLFFDDLASVDSPTQFNPSSNTRGLIVHGTRSLIQFGLEQKEHFTYPDGNDDVWGSILPFCDSLISYFCAFDLDSVTNEYPVLNCTRDESEDLRMFPEKWRKSAIAASFEEWLRNIFDSVIVREVQPVYWYEQDAARCYEKDLPLESFKFEALLHRIWALLSSQRYEEAICVAKEILDMTEAQDERCAAYHHLGFALFSLGRCEEAIDAFSHGLEGDVIKDSVDGSINTGYLNCYFHRAEVYIRLERYEEAIEGINQLLSLEPELYDMYRLRASIRSKMGDIQGAEEDRARAEECDRLFKESLLPEENKLSVSQEP